MTVQSALVTKMQLHLKPKNQVTAFCIVLLKTDQDLSQALRALGLLKSQNVINSVPHIANEDRIQSENKIHSLNAKWIATIDISGAQDLVKARRKMLRRTLPKHRMLYFSEARVRFLQKIRKYLFFRQLLKEQIENVGYLLNLYSGVPIDNFVEKTLGSLNGSKKKMNWLCPILPVSDGHVLKVKQIIETNFKSFWLSLLGNTFIGLCYVLRDDHRSDCEFRRSPSNKKGRAVLPKMPLRSQEPRVQGPVGTRLN